MAWTSSNILAGSDTTAIYLRTLFKNLLEHPDSLAALQTELVKAESNGCLSVPVTWKETRELPYLDACVKEAGRIHPPFGLPLERIVPTGGMVISGEYIPAGTIVGMNAWVVHRDRDVFGLDADQWRPERWLEADARTKLRMEQSLLTVRLQPLPSVTVRAGITDPRNASLVQVTGLVLARTFRCSRCTSWCQRFFVDTR